MEKYVAVFDVGTTAVKGLLINRRAEIFGEYSVRIETHHGTNGMVEQKPGDWWNSLKEITGHWFRNDILPDQIAMITFAGQMEDVIPILTSGKPINAILYSDTREETEAKEIRKEVNIEEVTGNQVTATTPLAKLQWMKKHENEVYTDKNF